MLDHIEEGRQGGHQHQPAGARVLNRRGFLAGGLSVSTVVLGGAASCESPTSDSDGDDADRSPQEEQPEPDPDHAFLVDALAAEKEIVAIYRATLTTHPDLTELLQPLLHRHREHAAFLSTLERMASSQALDDPLPTPEPLDEDGGDQGGGDQGGGDTSDEGRAAGNEGDEGRPDEDRADPDPPADGDQTPGPEDDPTQQGSESADAPEVPDTVDEAVAALLDAERAAAGDRLNEVARARSGHTARVAASIGACERSHVALLEAEARSS